MRVVAPALDRLVALHLTQFVTFRGFTLTETTPTATSCIRAASKGSGPCSPRRVKYSGEALHLNRAEWCVRGGQLF